MYGSYGGREERNLDPIQNRTAHHLYECDIYMCMYVVINLLKAVASLEYDGWQECKEKELWIE